MQTNDQGEIAGDIDVPAGLFRTGDRIVRITEHANNELASTTTVAETLFKSKGLLQNRENLIISTREPLLRRESLGDEGIVTDTVTRQTSQTNWINPMAQSFFVEPSFCQLHKKNSKGIYKRETEGTLILTSRRLTFCQLSKRGEALDQLDGSFKYYVGSIGGALGGGAAANAFRKKEDWILFSYPSYQERGFLLT